MSQAMAVTSADFDKEVLQASVPVLVDFWAKWCRPCLNVAPELDAVAAQIGEKAKILKVDVDSETELAVKYGILAIPALLIFKDGKAVDRITGSLSRQVIAAKLSQHV